MALNCLLRYQGLDEKQFNQYLSGLLTDHWIEGSLSADVIQFGGSRWSFSFDREMGYRVRLTREDGFWSFSFRAELVSEQSFAKTSYRGEAKDLCSVASRLFAWLDWYYSELTWSEIREF